MLRRTRLSTKVFSIIHFTPSTSMESISRRAGRLNNPKTASRAYPYAYAPHKSHRPTSAPGLLSQLTNQPGAFNFLSNLITVSF